MMLSRNSYKLSTSHSQKFCAPEGAPRVRFLVANCAKRINASATIQVRNIELVRKLVPSEPSRRALGGKPFSASAACATSLTSTFGPALSRNRSTARAAFSAPVAVQAKKPRLTAQSKEYIKRIESKNACTREKESLAHNSPSNESG